MVDTQFVLSYARNVWPAISANTKVVTTYNSKVIWPVWKSKPSVDGKYQGSEYVHVAMTPEKYAFEDGVVLRMDYNQDHDILVVRE